MYRNVFPHLEHFSYSLKSKSLYFLNENEFLCLQNTLYNSLMVSIPASYGTKEDSLFFILPKGLAPKICMYAVGEIWAHDSSVFSFTPDYEPGRVLSQAELRRHVSNVVKQILYNLYLWLPF